MDRRKIAILVFVLVICVIGVCGCMKQDEQLYKEGLLIYLEEKYNTTFEVKEAYQQFNGNDGIYFRVICVSEEYDDAFLVYCYLDDTHAGEKIEIENKTCTISDEYGEVLLEHRILDKLQEVVSPDMFVACDIIFSGRQPTKEELENGIEACAAIPELQTYVKIHLAAKGEISEEVKVAAETLLSQLKPHTGYLYMVIDEKRTKEEIEELYQIERNNFGNFLSGSQYDGYVEFTLYKQETGLQERKVVKE